MRRKNFAYVKRRERGAEIPHEVWMRNDGFTHAQPLLISSPVCIIGAVLASLTIGVFVLGVLTWQLSLAYSQWKYPLA